ncbi:MAG TPA: phospholipase D-like domain-containing protein [Thermoanaerobaculia bacterium]|nr:phospholipase D-like domain-containing protein [Thermoanaerobaculia bacterium]
MSARRRPETDRPPKRRPRRRARTVALAVGGVVVGMALSLAVAFLRRPAPPRWTLPHTFGVADATFVPSALAGSLMTSGNRLEILENGARIFPDMLAAIRSAKRSVDFEAYIFWSGAVGGEFRDAFVDRARSGVPVRILLDALGSERRLKAEDVAGLRRAGCRLVFFHGWKPWNRGAVDHRTHRRILVVDGRVGYTGGVGFADAWRGDADAKDHWRDTQVRVEGPAVEDLQGAFQENWTEATGETLAGDAFFPAPAAAGDARAAIVASSARYSTADVERMYAVALAAAERTIDVANSYFLPDADTIRLMTAAAARGVRVRVLVPGKVNDVPATKTAGRADFGPLLAAGVGIWEYAGTMFHPKLMVIDGRFSTIGTANFDGRSFRLNEEINLASDDPRLAAALEASFARDLSRARRYTLAEWRQRPLVQRISEWALRPLKSQL